MKKNIPTVSFVIRTFNEQKFIGKVLNYVFEQTFKDFEVIIVDSGSTDKTLEIVKKFPIKLIQIKPEEFGFSYSLNLGISKAKGEYIAIISGHSIPITNTWLEDGLKNFKDKKVAGITGICISLIPIGYFSRKAGLFIASRSFKKYKKINTPWLTNTNSIIRKDLWKKYSFDESLPECEDCDWAKEMIARGYRIAKDPKYSVFHSHLLINKQGYIKRWLRWRKVCKRIDKRKRPRKSATKININ